MNVDAEDLWIVTDTRFGFIDYRGKRIMDRIMPILKANGIILVTIVASLQICLEERSGWSASTRAMCLP